MNRFDLARGTTAEVHVIYKNQRTYPFNEVFTPERLVSFGFPAGATVTASQLTEDQVRTALSQKYDVPLSEFADHFVEVNANGNITVRPNAEWGVN